MEQTDIAVGPHSTGIRRRHHVRGRRGRPGPMVRAFWIALGSMSLGLGVLGIFLPILPTTPFLLLAAYCYDRGSPRLHGWLLGNRVLGRYLRDYTEGRGIPAGTKAVAIAVLWATILLTVLAVLGDPDGAVGPVPVRVVDPLLLVIATGVTLHLVRLPTTPARSAASFK